LAFENLNLNPQVLKALAKAGYTEPTKIQSKAIPKIAKGFDIRASAQTGSGKTAAFLLPALNRLAAPSKVQGHGPRLLVLVPTRELGMQIATQAEKYSRYLNRVKTVCIGGGVPYRIQMKKLSKPYEILIATPGRLIDYIQRGKMNFSRLEMLVLDEADRMLDMGFLQPVKQIVSKTPSSRQTLLFSATLQGPVLELSEQLLQKPMDIVVHSEQVKHDHIEQKLYFADNLSHKNRLLDHLLSEEGVENTIIFTATKRHANQLARDLKAEGHKTAALHGDLSQNQRTRTIHQFREGKFNILVATDVAARGIDVPSITHVINFDLPHNTEDYVHRIGRTGRAGASGVAISLAAGSDAFLLKKIEKYTQQKVEVCEIEGLEPKTKPDFNTAPKRGRKSSRGKFRPKSKFGKHSSPKKPGKGRFNSKSKPGFAKGKFQKRRTQKARASAKS